MAVKRLSSHSRWHNGTEVKTMMNEGILFYWFIWCGWIITTFLMKKTQWRTLLSFYLLFAIILSGISFTIWIGNINSSIFLFMFSGLIYFGIKNNELFHDVTAVFIVATVYVSIHLFFLYDPVRFFIEKKVIVALVISITVFFISKKRLDFFIISVTGIVFGDVLYELLIYRLKGYVQIGSYYCLDVLALSSMILFFVVVLIDMFKKIKRVSEKKVSPARPIS